MRALLAPLSELGEYEEIRELLARGKASAALSGCADSQKLHMIYGLSEGFRRKLIITFNDLRAKELYEDYQFYDRNFRRTFTAISSPRSGSRFSAGWRKGRRLP